MAMPTVVSSGALTGIRARSGEHLVCAETPQEWVAACVKLVRTGRGCASWPSGAQAGAG